jgi:hypothetical protein
VVEKNGAKNGQISETEVTITPFLFVRTDACGKWT